MTREEAIKILKAIRVYECYPKSASEETKEAIDMAIEALKITQDTQESTQDLISREDAIKNAHFPMIDDAGYEVVRVDDILALPSATCEDCIWHVCNYNKIDWEGEDGYISRRDAVNEIDEWIQRATDNETDVAIKEFLSFLKERINTLPSAEPKTGAKIVPKKESDMYITGYRDGHDDATKTARWIQKDLCADRFCSNCDYVVWDSEAEEYNFCPNCGARMKGADDE